ncbi:MAG: undecaprenyldiphospho-muramoylpentapeptide beta-N-acetylglucosaminyltransferase [Thermodesulfobacteriota bacterium]|jgi:UDP-N-acetylglucosamine--N-acetylmuramyl-(pentapeptide) pyrophosphoryl-undecaprenol N-acetylglucosamine transferase|nr:MAG: undecaprenyldiphospho-muramoylpentapeptide beta-N-acetylglucosaminyltransferase [Thermodesulfobacteriota bacterium]
MRIIIAGGGTGGHLFPGIALAEEFKSRSLHNVVMFVGTKKGIEQRIIPPMGYELKTISGAGILGGSLRQRVMGFFQFLIGFFQALWLIRSLQPDLVVGTGGYASVSVILAAYLLRVETAICEQNSIPGLTNRVLGRLVKKVFIAFEESDVFFPRRKIFLTGNPVRKEFLCQPSLSEKKGDRFTLLILGGSQGARSINRGMIECLDYIASLRDKVEIIHQTGFQDFSWVKEAYEKKGFKADVFPFITEMASAYGRADLVVSRAGAISITEILVTGKPSVLIPYPYAAYNHQEMNAKILADKGAARMILDKDLRNILGKTILCLINHYEKLKEMGDKAKVLALPEAARTIVDHYFSKGEVNLRPRETKGGYCHL